MPIVSEAWKEFVDGWSRVATAEEARDGIERLYKDRPKSKMAAVDLATRQFANARSNDELVEIAAELLSEIRADGIKQWAKEVTRQVLTKDDGIDAILDAYFPSEEDDDDSNRREHVLRHDARDEHSPGGESRGAANGGSKAVLRCGKRVTTSKEYFGIGDVGGDGSWRAEDLKVSGCCRKCRRSAALESATGQNLAATANQLKDLLNPMNWLSAATKADFNFFRCSLCKYLQKVCAECDEICETTASQCNGCGHAFG